MSQAPKAFTLQFKSTNAQILRAVLSIASAALVIRIMGLLNQTIITRRFGADATMDAYFVASTLPILLAQLAAGAIEAAVIPAYTHTRLQGKEQASIFLSTLLNLLLVVTLLLTIVMLIFRRQLVFISAPALDQFRAGFAAYLAPFIFPALLLMIMISFLECILNAEGQFSRPAFAGIFVPLITVLFVLIGGKALGVVMLCVGTIAGLCIQLAVIIVSMRHTGLSYRPIVNLHHPELRQVLVTAWPVLLGALISQASPLVDQIFASYLSPGNIAALNYALKLVSVPIGIIFVSVGRSILPSLARQASSNDMKSFKDTLRLYLWIVGISTILLTLFILGTAPLLVRILFQHGAFTSVDTNRTATILMGFVVGLTPMALGIIIARAFSALGKTRVLMGVSLLSVIANAIFDYIFARLWQGIGIALATSAVYMCTMYVLFFTLHRTVGQLSLFTPPTELRDMIRKGRTQLFSPRVRSRLAKGLASYHITRVLVQLIIALLVFAIGIFGVFHNSLYTLRASFGSLVVLALLRYHYALLLAWVFLDAFIGSTIPIFNGGNLNTALTAPTMLLMLYLPVKQTLKRMPALISLFAFLVWVFASIGISSIGVGPFLTIWTLMLDYIAVSILVINVITTERRLLKLIDAILLVSAFIAVYGIYGYFTKQNGVADTQNPLLFRTSSVFSNTPTALAFFLSAIIPLTIYRTFLLRGFKRAGGLLLMLVFLVALALTFTRTAYISVPLSVIVMMLFLPSRGMKITLISTLLGLTLLLVLLGTVEHVPIFERFFNQDISTLNGRTYLWQALIDHLNLTQLQGNGLNASDLLLTNLQIGFKGVIGTAPHNLFLGTLYDHGLIGLILLMLVFITLFVSLIKGIRKTTAHHRMLFATALAVYACLLLQSFDSNEIWNQSVGLYFWIIMTLPFASCWSATGQSSRIEQDTLDEPAEVRTEVVQVGRPEYLSHGTQLAQAISKKE